MNTDKCIGFWVKNIPYIWHKNTRTYIVDERTFDNGLDIDNKRYFKETFLLTDNPKIMKLFLITKTLRKDDIPHIKVNGDNIKIPVKYKSMKNLVSDMRDFLLIDKTKNINILSRIYSNQGLSVKIPSPRATLTKRKKEFMFKSLFSFIYLVHLSKTYKNVCITFGDISKTRFASGLLRRGAITVILKKENSKPTISYYNIEKLFSFCLKSKRRFIFVPISISYKFKKFGGSRHANFLLFDTKKKHLEIYDPWGEPKVENIQDFIGTEVLKIFKLKDWKIFKSANFCPKRAFQRLQAEKGEGYCGMWRLWLLELRLQNEDEDIENLIKKSLIYINQKHLDFEIFIRKYYNYLSKEALKILKKLNIKPGRKLEKVDIEKIEKYIS